MPGPVFEAFLTAVLAMGGSFSCETGYVQGRPTTEYHVLSTIDDGRTWPVAVVMEGAVWPLQCWLVLPPAE